MIWNHGDSTISFYVAAAGPLISFQRGLDYGHWICLLNADGGFSSSKRILWCRANGFWYKANSSQLKIIFKMPISIFVVSRTNPKKLPLINWWPVIKVSFSRSFVLTSHFPFYIRLKTHIIRISKPETRIFIHIWWLFKWFL